MALFNPILGAIKGKVAGVVFQGGSSGDILRSKGKPVNRFTILQSLRREGLSGISKGWAYTLSVAQRQAWDSLAVGVVFQDAFGNSQAMSGYMLFTSLNFNRSVMGDTPLVEAPANLDVTGLATADLAETFYGTRAGFIECGPAGGAAESYAVYGIQNKQDGKSFPSGEYRFWGNGQDITGLNYTYGYSGQYPLQEESTFTYVWIRRYNSVNGVLSPGLLSFTETVSP